MFGFIKKIQRGIAVFFPTRKSIGKSGSNSFIEFPVFISSPKSVVMEADTRLRQGCKLLNAERDIITIKRYTVISMNCVIVTNNHKSTVGIPQILLGISGLNDQSHNTTIEEDVWLGANVTVVGVDRIGRGSLIGACSTVTHDVPPYAIMVGSPARIIGVKFSIDQIMEHERILYPESQRYSREYLEELFKMYYQDKRVYGVKTELSDEEFENLKRCMGARKFTDPDYINRIEYLRKR